MSVSKLPNGRWRSQIAVDGKNLSVPKLIGGPKSYGTKREAKAARAKAREALGKSQVSSVTVRGFWERWTTDPLFARPKESTNIHNQERTRAFVEKYGELPMGDVDATVVSGWLWGGKNQGTVPQLRAMWNDAMSLKAGALVDRNPFARLGISKGPGLRDQQPPTEEMVWALIGHAKDLTGPHWAAWLQLAAFTGMRPGEIDALRWERVDFDRSRIIVAEQYSSNSKSFTTPKNGKQREAPMTAPAREALLSVPQQHEFCFVNLREHHWTAGSRAYHWSTVRAAAGWKGSLYLATRHFAGWYMYELLGMPAEDVAISLGHTDGGELVRRLYGHKDRDKALTRVVEAYEQSARVKPLRLVKEDESA